MVILVMHSKKHTICYPIHHQQELVSLPLPWQYPPFFSVTFLDLDLRRVPNVIPWLELQGYSTVMLSGQPAFEKYPLTPTHLLTPLQNF